MNFDTIAQEFTRLFRGEEGQSRSGREKMIALLRPLLTQDDLDPGQKAFAYWQISDNYALLREHAATYRNHRAFESYLADQDEKYRLMLIADATQKLSLVCGGHENYWNGLYYGIMEDCSVTRANYVIYFQVLRTALYYHEAITDYRAVGGHALSKMVTFLEAYRDDSQYPWFEMVYYECRLKYNFRCSLPQGDAPARAFDAFCRLAPYLRTEEADKQKQRERYEEPLFGTYESANSLRSMYVQARCIQNYILTLMDLGYTEQVRECLATVGEEEFNSPYFKSRIDRYFGS